MNEVLGLKVIRKQVLKDVLEELNKHLNTHVLDDKYHEIVCSVYKCPFRLPFQQD